MAHSRRAFLKSAGASAVASAALPPLVDSRDHQSLSPDEIAALFAHLPGDLAFKIFAPAENDDRQFLVQRNSTQTLFVASAIKTFALCEALRQADSPGVVDLLQKRELTLDSTVWSPGSPTFNPPDLTGLVSERATMEAMITSSDNTATDMIFALATPESIRKFVASAGLTHTLVPDSTRAVAAYVFGAPNYLTITWDELLRVVQERQVHPFLNSVETLASSADDFVSYYSRALRGEFFKHQETLNEFRRMLTLCDFIYLVPLPLGVSAYAKSGNADARNFHARSIAGGLFVPNRWIFFAFILNWYAASLLDPQTVDQFFSAIHRSLALVRDALVCADD
jgi:beta-lactamase class A